MAYAFRRQNKKAHPRSQECTKAPTQPPVVRYLRVASCRAW